MARQAYQRALVRARERSTRTSWLRLLTASRNLKSAKRDGERAGARPAGRPTAAGTRPAARPELPARGGAVAVLPSPRHLRETERRLELAREWERSRVLRERSRALIDEARTLRIDLARIARSRPHPYTANG